MVETALLGGAFDPVHRGHLELAEEARRACDAEQVLFIPSAAPPHKKGEELTPFAMRVEMLRLAIADRPCFAVSEVEAQVVPPSYTIDVLEALSARINLQECAFVIGSDAFLEVKTWKSYRKVLRSIDFIVVPRQGVSASELDSQIGSLGYVGDGQRRYHEKSGRCIIRLAAPVTAVSSTEIRNMPCKSEEMRRVVPDPVCEYIITNRLYRCR